MSQAEQYCYFDSCLLALRRMKGHLLAHHLNTPPTPGSISTIILMDEIYKYIRRGQVENKQGEAENYNEDTNKRDPF